MYFLDEIIKNKVTKKKVLLPLNGKDKKKGSMAYLLTPSLESSKRIISDQTLIKSKYFFSYYMERSVLYYIDNTKEIAIPETVNEISLNNYLKSNNKLTFVGFEADTKIVSEYFAANINDIEDKFGTKIPNTVISISNDEKKQYCNNGKVGILSPTRVNKNMYGSYEKYMDIFMYLMAITAANSIINESLLISSALYFSDVINTSTKKYFSSNVVKLVKYIGMYVEATSEKSFINDILLRNNTARMLTKVFKDKIKEDIEPMLNLTFKNTFIREFTDYKFEEPDEAIYELGSIDIGNNMWMIFDESSAAYNMAIKKSLYKDRIKTNKELLEKYEAIKKEIPKIKFAWVDLNKYKNLNAFNDLSYYNDVFFRNTNLPYLRQMHIYLDLMERFILDDRFKDYTKKTVIIPVNDWKEYCRCDQVWNIAESVNPISCMFKALITEAAYITSAYKDINFIFLGEKSYFVVDFSADNNVSKFKALFLKNIKLVTEGFIPNEDDEPESSPKAIAVDIIDKIEKAQKINISNIQPSATNKSSTTDIVKAVKDTEKKETEKSDKPPVNNKTETEKDNDTQKKVMKQELVDKINQASSTATSTDDALEKLDQDEEVKKILSSLASDPDDGPNMSAARTSRLLKLQDDFLDKEFENKSMKDFLTYDENAETEKINPISLNVDSVNPEWEELKYANMNESYNLNQDLVAMFNFFHDKKHPLVIKDIKVEDTSTSEDEIETYTVVYESESGKRFTIVIDIPKFIDGKYMKLRGNMKNIASQLYPMPIMKTEEETVRIATTYNRIFVKRFGATAGKSNVVSDRLVKTLSKNKFDGLRILEGDNTRVCSKYECPIDYIDIGSKYSEIETANYLFQFNQDKLRKEYGDKIDVSKGFPYGYDKKSKQILYYTPKSTKDSDYMLFSYTLLCMMIGEVKGLNEAYEKTTTSVKYVFSQAKILNTNLPLIIICAYVEGLEKTLRKASVTYNLSETRPKIDKNTEDIIRFKDGYLTYKINYSSSMLLNGLKVCNTEEISLEEINKKTTYLNVLDMFGSRIIADGLDNFYELFIDYPITYNSLKYYNLPTDFVSLLLYANDLLTDNKYIKHTDIASSRRIRRNELIADLLYREVLSKAYGDYCTGIKHRGQGTFAVKRNALINAVLLNNTTEDQSIINALNEYEAYNKVTPEGPGGLNSARSYTLDKRSYDDSMKDVLSMSTGFAGKVGIPRQATIDANVHGYRGYITSDSESDEDDINVTKTLCMTEALTPYGITRDDPFRSAMNFVQTSKHGMRCNHSDPLLVTTGADEALPYLISNIFAFKAKDNGTVIEKTDDHMVIEYKTKDGKVEHDYIDLSENVEKNSSSGFFVTLKLDSDLKVGQKVKKGQVVAYDKKSFSDEMGYNDNIAYNVGTLAKFAIMNTDEGYEDSAIISQDLVDKMTADIVMKKQVILSKDTNIFNMVSKGQEIKEGDTLLIIQKASDEEDVNVLLRNLAGDEEDITNLGRQKIESKVTGIVQDIVISRTVDKDELSPSLKKLVNAYEKDINDKKKIMKTYGINQETKLPSTDKLPATGKLKDCEDGVLIEFYLKRVDKMSVGDKMIYYSALKGVTKDIFPVGKEPTSSFRPDEKIHSLLSIGSVNGRMTCSIKLNAVLNKGLIELGRKVKDILGIPYDINL